MIARPNQSFLIDLTVLSVGQDVCDLSLIELLGRLYLEMSLRADLALIVALFDVPNSGPNVDLIDLTHVHLATVPRERLPLLTITTL